MKCQSCSTMLEPTCLCWCCGIHLCEKCAIRIRKGRTVCKHCKDLIPCKICGTERVSVSIIEKDGKKLRTAYCSICGFEFDKQKLIDLGLLNEI